MSSADGTRWLNMSRAFGDWGYPGVLCKPYVCTLDVSDAKYLILGSDGLTERWSLGSVAAHVKEFMLSHAPPPQPPPIPDDVSPADASVNESSSPSSSSPRSESDAEEERSEAAAAAGVGSPSPAGVGAGSRADTTQDPAGGCESPCESHEDTEMLSPGAASGPAAASGEKQVNASGSCNGDTHASSLPDQHHTADHSSSPTCNPHPQQQQTSTKSQHCSEQDNASGESSVEQSHEVDDDLRVDDTCNDQSTSSGRGSCHKQRKQRADRLQVQQQQEREIYRRRLEQEEEARCEQRSRKIRSDVQQLARELVQQAVLSGSTDNITVVVMDVQVCKPVSLSCCTLRVSCPCCTLTRFEPWRIQHNMIF